MTTQEDWAFRASHFRHAAMRLETQAQGLLDLAADFRARAGRCEARASTPIEITASEMDKIEDEAAKVVTLPVIRQEPY